MQFIESLIPAITGHTVDQIIPQERVTVALECLDLFWDWIGQWTLQNHGQYQAIRVHAMRSYGGAGVTAKFEEMNDIITHATQAFFEQYI